MNQSEIMRNDNKIDNSKMKSSFPEFEIVNNVEGKNASQGQLLEKITFILR